MNIFTAGLSAGGVNRFVGNTGRGPGHLALARPAPRRAAPARSSTPARRSTPVRRSTSSSRSGSYYRPTNTYRAPVDPRAEEKAAFKRQFPGALSNIQGNAASGFATGARKMQGNAESLFNRVKSGQRAINSSRENVELNRLNGVRDIVNFVRTGLQRGGATLANSNSLQSSAAEGLTRGYQTIGNDRNRDLQNDAFLENREIGFEQDELNTVEKQGTRELQRLYQDQVEAIGNQVREQLAKINIQARGLSLPDQVNVNAKRQEIIRSGQGKLKAAQNWLNSQLKTTNPLTQQQIIANAMKLQQGGAAGSDMFEIDTDFTEGEGPEGPQLGQLPLFVRPREDKK